VYTTPVLPSPVFPQVPPEGEFALINYRTSSGFKPPFRLMTTVEPDPQVNTKAVLTLRLWWVKPPASCLSVECAASSWAATELLYHIVDGTLRYQQCMFSTPSGAHAETLLRGS
jgi:hypothetical protein